jgi:hypothetical protein
VVATRAGAATITLTEIGSTKQPTFAPVTDDCRPKH